MSIIKIFLIMYIVMLIICGLGALVCFFVDVKRFKDREEKFEVLQDLKKLEVLSDEEGVKECKDL